MFIPKAMRIVHFEDVAIPENKELFGRFGTDRPTPVGAYIGQSMAHMPENKIDEISRYAQEGSRLAEEHAQKVSEGN